MKKTIHEAKQGETWDIIAKEVYGDELNAQDLMKANLNLLHIFVFSGGEKVACPELELKENVALPPWRK